MEIDVDVEDIERLCREALRAVEKISTTRDCYTAFESVLAAWMMLGAINEYEQKTGGLPRSLHNHVKNTWQAVNTVTNQFRRACVRRRPVDEEP